MAISKRKNMVHPFDLSRETARRSWRKNRISSFWKKSTFPSIYPNQNPSVFKAERNYPVSSTLCKVLFMRPKWAAHIRLLRFHSLRRISCNNSRHHGEDLDDRHYTARY